MMHTENAVRGNEPEGGRIIGTALQLSATAEALLKAFDQLAEKLSPILHAPGPSEVADRPTAPSNYSELAERLNVIGHDLEMAVQMLQNLRRRVDL